MSSGYYKTSKRELVAIYHLEFYKNKKKWKLSDEKNKKPSPLSDVARMEPESDKNLNKTYNVEIDPAVEKEKNSPLNSAFIHEIPIDEEPQEAEDAGPPPPTTQSSEEAWPEMPDQPEIRKLWIKDQEDTDSLKVLQNSQDPDTWTNPTTEDGPFLQSILRSTTKETSPQPDLIQDKPINPDCTNQTKPIVTDKAQDDWIQQEMASLWSKEAALLKEMMRTGQWDIPPPSLPVFLKDKGLSPSSDVPDGPFKNKGSLQIGQAKPQAPSSDCLKMLLCPNDWIKKNNEQKVQNQDPISGTIAWPNAAPESDPHKDQGPDKWFNKEIWNNQLLPSDPSFNNSTGPETMNNIKIQKSNSQNYNNNPDNQSNPELDTLQITGAINENISRQFCPDMWPNPPAPGMISKTTAGSVAWTNKDNANNIQPDIWPNPEPNSAHLYNNANPDTWVNKENSKKYHPYSSQKSASPSNPNLNTPPFAWMKENGTKYPPNKWVNPALVSGTPENWRNRESNSKCHPDNWSTLVPTSDPPSKTTPDNWRVKDHNQNYSPALASTTSTIVNKDNDQKLNAVTWTNHPSNVPQIRQDPLNNLGTKLDQPQISGQNRPQHIQISGQNLPNLPEISQEEAWLYQQGQKGPYIWTAPGINPEMLAQNILTNKAWLEQKLWQNVDKEWCMPAEGAPDVMYEEIAEQYIPVDQQTLKPQYSMDEMQTPTQIRKNTEKWLRRLLAIYRANDDADDDQAFNESINFIREAHEVPHSSENDPNESRECVCSFVSPAALPALPSQLLSTAILHATKSLQAVLKEQLIRDQLRARTLMQLQEFPTRDVAVIPEVTDGSHLTHPTTEIDRQSDGLIRIAMGRPYRLPNAN